MAEDYEKTFLSTDDTPSLIYAWECQGCGAVVTNRDKHDFWHDNG